MKILSLLIAAASLCLSLVCHAQGTKDIGYDAAANPVAALEKALKEARAGNKRVLVIAGGDWCRWCYSLDTFLKKNADVKAEVDEAFVTLKVYYGEKNDNRAFFAKLPAAAGYPHFWVLGSDGKLLRSTNTGGLEDGGDSYDKALFLGFVRKMRGSPRATPGR